MSYAALLRSSADIYRKSGATDGPYASGTFTLQTSGVRCRIEMLSAKEMIGDQSGAQPAISTHRLFLPSGVDIRPEDEVEIDSIRYIVQFPDTSPGGTSHHIECMCKRVQ